ncbi:MAG: hypothetical protein KAX49_12660 [Halanaerobiales bacterium]|nr:hypothetical protein [Halanaerobiales bacterium]
MLENQEQWIIKVKEEIPYVEIPEEFRVDSDIESMPLEDFVNIITQINGDESEQEDTSRCFIRVKHCCLKVKHCCVKPPAGTKYSTGKVQWCSNK